MQHLWCFVVGRILVSFTLGPSYWLFPPCGMFSPRISAGTSCLLHSFPPILPSQWALPDCPIMTDNLHQLHHLYPPQTLEPPFASAPPLTPHQNLSATTLWFCFFDFSPNCPFFSLSTVPANPEPSSLLWTVAAASSLASLPPVSHPLSSYPPHWPPLNIILHFPCPSDPRDSTLLPLRWRLSCSPVLRVFPDQTPALASALLLFPYICTQQFAFPWIPCTSFHLFMPFSPPRIPFLLSCLLHGCHSPYSKTHTVE